MYIYTFESKLSSENYLVFSSLLKFISLLLPLWPKIMIYSFWNPGHNSSKDKQSYLLIHRVEKTYVGEVTIQMLKYYRNLFEKRFFSKIGGNNTTNNSFINIIFSLFCQFESTVSDKSVQISVIQLIFKRKNGQLFIIIDPL